MFHGNLTATAEKKVASSNYLAFYTTLRKISRERCFWIFYEAFKVFPAVKAVINSFFCLYGARSTCLLFSLIECAKINNNNPEEYLSSIFELAADTTGWTDSNWSELLPWNIKLIKKSDVSTVLVA